MTSLNKPLRLGIVGLGKMGRLHCKSWRQVPGIQLRALVDNDPGKAEWAAEQGCEFFSDSRALLGKVDLAVIATPSSEHLGSALPLLEGRIHCLVEKPLALDFAACRQLVLAAQQHQVLLAVGHSERFNPAIQLAQQALAGPVSRADILRVVPRLMAGMADTDVVLDLMVHDIDWLLDTLGEPGGEIRILEHRRSAGQLSHVRCELAFAGGKRVNLTACREDQVRRQVILHGPDESRIIDLDQTGLSHQPDALTRQALAFVQSLGGRRSAIALGRDALAVMDLSERIRQHCSISEVITC
ncbi:Gfo/Idh/MocA family protein [Pseudomonas sp. PB120]|uniref:Gfo/Idh/MocA family protein n=1 Tax=Pseudomonas sp. PB120 TaxID=2494700 RepID=UPI0012FD370A|nr:Gfo/Idh/MocA family oxidoreductase [Pseudomonas sp. PB120]